MISQVDRLAMAKNHRSINTAISFPLTSIAENKELVDSLEISISCIPVKQDSQSVSEADRFPSSNHTCIWKADHDKNWVCKPKTTCTTDILRDCLREKPIYDSYYSIAIPSVDSIYNILPCLIGAIWAVALFLSLQFCPR